MSLRYSLTAALAAVALVMTSALAHAQTYSIIVPLTPNARIGAGGGDATTPPAESSYGPVSLSAASLDFGALNVGDAQVRALEVLNAGEDPARVTAISTDHGAFNATHNCPSELAPGQSCTVEVTAQPTVGGNLTQQLRVTDSLATRTATLHVQVGAPSLDITGDGAFPVTHLGESVSRTFIAANAGTGSLALSSIHIEGDDDFSLNGGGCSAGTVLAAAQSCTVQVTASPENTGVRAGTLRIEAGGLAASEALTVPVPDPATNNVAEVGAAKTTLIAGGGDSTVLTATVRDAAGLPAGAGIEVSWSTSFTPARYGSFGTQKSMTDENGVAHNTWTTGIQGGNAQVRVHAQLGATGTRPTLFLSLLPDMAYSVKSVTSISSGMLAGGWLPVMVQVQDQYGNNAPAGVTVYLDKTGGTLAASSAVTDASGRVNVQFTAPNPAPVGQKYTVMVWYGGQAATTRDFTIKAPL